MKIRNGFVSNSSSSSYVILLPDDLDVDTLVYSNMKSVENVYRYSEEFNREFPYRRGVPHPKKIIVPYEFIENIIKKIKKAIKDKYIYQDDYQVFNVVSEVMRDHIISDTETGPDSGTITFLTPTQLKAKLDKAKNLKKMSDEEKEEFIEKIKKNTEDWKLEREEKKRKAEELKQKMRHVDPYAEEDWGDEV